jgi:hypothetical protein
VRQIFKRLLNTVGIAEVLLGGGSGLLVQNQHLTLQRDKNFEITVTRYNFGLKQNNADKGGFLQSFSTSQIISNNSAKHL